MPPALTGLSSAEAASKLAAVGPNLLPEKPPPGKLALLLNQLKSPLVFILIIAGAVSALTGEFADASIIFFAVIVNTVLGYLQEGRAGQALAALKKMVSSTVEVVRDGAIIPLPSSQLVPGDIVVLKSGLKIPADGVVVEQNRLFSAEAVITGESVAVAKPVGEKLYMGCLISSGIGRMRVEITGAGTRMGHIAQNTQETKQPTPLQQQIASFSRKLIFLVVALAVSIFAVGVAVGLGWLDMFTLAVAVAVSSIPEGLLVATTVILAIGMQRILKRQGLVKTLASAETLGGVTVICTDKTGTLTEGQLRVVDHVGDEEALALQILLSADDPMVSAARDWASAHYSGRIESFAHLDNIPFSPQQKVFVGLNRYSADSNLVTVNGAPEVILDWTGLTSGQKAGLKSQMAEITARGDRILGLAKKTVPASVTKLDMSLANSGLEWVGLLVYNDPVRPGVKTVLDQAASAGIRTILITGDYPQTAKFVMHQLGLSVTDDQILLGDQIKDLSTADLAARLASVRLLARTSPDQKLKIVEALQSAGEVVAMMGDGVNDAPALHKSNIGVVVASATDVARESADLVLLDSNFQTVLAAIEEGRVIFDNIRKVILYLLCDAFEEIVVIVGSLVLGIPIPLAAVQILWINLFSDGFPNLALTVDPKRAGVMAEPPRSPREGLVNRWMLSLIAVVSGLYGFIALAIFWFVHTTTGDEVLVRSVAFVTLGINTLFYIFSVRSLTTPIWKSRLFDNKWLNLSIILGFAMQILPFATPFTRSFFDLKPVPVFFWLLAVSVSLGVTLVIELMKLAYSNRRPSL